MQIIELAVIIFMVWMPDKTFSLQPILELKVLKAVELKAKAVYVHWQACCTLGFLLIEGIKL